VRVAGVCQAGPIAVAFAARRPERVRALVLVVYGTYARCGPLGTRQGTEPGLIDDTMVRPELDLPSSLREVFARLLLPAAAAEVVAAFVMTRRSASASSTTGSSSVNRVWAAHDPPQESVDHLPVTAPPATTLRLHAGQQRFQSSPLIVAEVTGHAPQRSTDTTRCDPSDSP
jgi:pimeloyl-ACP methyl ester carboxylesterase